MKSKPGANRGTGQALYERAKQLIPGGTQLLSKRPELFLPDQWPAYYARAKGIEVRDLDGRTYRDFTHCGVGTCILGFADEEVNAAVVQAIDRGSMATLNCPEEVELAELLLDCHPWADNVRYARSGGEAMAIAIRIARAATARTRIAVCGYHGWSDWYIAANLGDSAGLDGHMLPGLDPAGVPEALRGTTMAFPFDRLDALEAMITQSGEYFAAIVMEPCRGDVPDADFLKAVRALAERCGAVLIFDEVTSGWRMNCGGVHLLTPVAPDIAVFAKGMSNGYAMAAVVGVRDVMEAAQGSFISSTYWTERIGPAAAIATIGKLHREPVADHLIKTGERIKAGWRDAAQAAQLPLSVRGIPPLADFGFEVPDADAAMTLFTQEMLARGFLAGPQVYATWCHGEADVGSYLDAVGEVFKHVSDAVAAGDPGRKLNGPIKHSGFKRLN